MDSMIIILFICVAIPLAFSLALLEKRSRLFVCFIIVGCAVCVAASAVNSFLQRLLGQSYLYLTTNVTPISEELLKAVPVLFFAYAVNDNRKALLPVAMATGIGFAVVENLFILVRSSDSISLGWAVGRVFGASLMHGICTASVGYGISFVRKKKKLFYTGTFALLVFAMVYHSVYNLVIQSEYSDLGIFLPFVTYIPISVWFVLYKRKAAENSGGR